MVSCQNQIFINFNTEDVYHINLDINHQWEELGKLGKVPINVHVCNRQQVRHACKIIGEGVEIF